MAMDDTSARGEGAAKRGDQAQRIAETLRGEIVSGDFPQGTELRQETLAKRFEVSRMPVRDALRRLDAEGLVELRPNRSATVTLLSLADLTEIYEMRIAAEALALRFALPEISNAQIDRAAEIHRQMIAAPLTEFGRLNALFHETLYTPCAMPRLIKHIETLGIAADRYLRTTVAELNYADKSNREHGDLLEACRARDEEAAMRCITSHIREAGEALAGHLRARAHDKFD